MTEHPKYIQLIEDGYFTLEKIYPQELIDRMRGVTDVLVDLMTEDEIHQQRSTGSMISVMKHEGLVDLIADAGALEAMESIGLREMRFQSGYVISKPPQSPQLFWHFDKSHHGHAGISWTISSGGFARRWPPEALKDELWRRRAVSSWEPFFGTRPGRLIAAAKSIVIAGTEPGPWGIEVDVFA